MNACPASPSTAGVEVLDREPASPPREESPATALLAIDRDYKRGVHHLRLAEAGAKKLTRDFPGLWRGWRLLAQVLVQRGEWAQAISLLESCCERFAASPNPWLALARVHTSTGNTGAAAKALDTALERGATFADCATVERATRLNRPLGDAEIDALALEVVEREQPLRKVLRDDSRAEVQVVGGPGAPVVIVFTGMADRVSVPLETMDRMFAARGLSAIYCRDFSRRMYIHGIGSLAPDAAGTVAALRSLLDNLGATRVVTLGNSVGGHGAIHYGLRLKADAVVSYAGPTNAKMGFLSTFDARSGIVARKLNRDPIADELDLKPLAANAAQPVQMHLVYGAGMHEDRVHAEYLAGVAGVQLHGDPECADHGVLSRHIANGKFAALLEGVVRQP